VAPGGGVLFAPSHSRLDCHARPQKVRGSHDTKAFSSYISPSPPCARIRTNTANATAFNMGSRIRQQLLWGISSNF